MDLFVIRNYLSVLTAESIFLKSEKESAIFLIPSKEKKYFEKLKMSISKDILKRVKVIYYKDPLYLSFKSIIGKKNDHNIQLEKNQIEYILENYEIKKIFICCINHSFEKHFYSIASNKNILINFYEEGISLYFNEKKEILIKKMVKRMISAFTKESKHFLLIYPNDMTIRKVYCLFPEVYPIRKNVQVEKINLNITLKENREIIKNLLVTRPLSEDGLLKEEFEMEFLLDYFEENNLKDITLKSHPRESEIKINKLIKKAFTKGIKINRLNENTPLEKLVENYDIKKIIGYETGGLVYLSELYGISCDSLIKKLIIETNSKYFKKYYLFYRSKFLKINYV